MPPELGPTADPNSIQGAFYAEAARFNSGPAPSSALPARGRPAHAAGPQPSTTATEGGAETGLVRAEGVPARDAVARGPTQALLSDLQHVTGRGQVNAGVYDGPDGFPCIE